MRVWGILRIKRASFKENDGWENLMRYITMKKEAKRLKEEEGKGGTIARYKEEENVDLSA
jgi:hypothetical protein